MLVAGILTIGDAGREGAAVCRTDRAAGDTAPSLACVHLWCFQRAISSLALFNSSFHLWHCSTRHFIFGVVQRVISSLALFNASFHLWPCSTRHFIFGIVQRVISSLALFKASHNLSHTPLTPLCRPMPTSPPSAAATLTLRNAAAPRQKKRNTTGCVYCHRFVVSFLRSAPFARAHIGGLSFTLCIIILP